MLESESGVWVSHNVMVLGRTMRDLGVRSLADFVLPDGARALSSNSALASWNEIRRAPYTEAASIENVGGGDQGL